MGNDQYFDNLVACYLSNELSEEDVKWFLELVYSDDDKKRRFEEATRVFELARIEESLSDINIDQEWERFRLKAIPESIKSVEDNETEPDIVRPKLRLLKTIAASSLVILLVSIIVMKWQGADQSSEDKLVLAGSDNENRVALEYEINTTSEVKRFMLPDGSEVILYPKSWINFDRGMAGEKRSVKLTGKASFEVKKDTNRPFTVSSGDIATTALGTRFVVTAFEGDNSIKVSLEEGRVVIRSSDEQKSILKQDYFLRPGEEFVFEKKSAKGLVRRFKAAATMVRERKKVIPEVEEISTPVIDKNSSWFMFNNQALPEVFEHLKEMYNVDITYAKHQVSNLYFIGAFRSTDSIGQVLQKIAELNDLQISRVDDSYKINKRK